MRKRSSKLRWQLRFLAFMLTFVSSSIFVNNALIARGASGEIIHSFASKVSLSTSGSADVTETIFYDFGSSARHGIYRTIPTTYKTTGKDVYYLGFNLLDVTDETGGAQKSSQSASNGNAVIKIGDASRMVTGVHTYKIHYTLAPIVTQGTDFDQLLLNITGNDWDVPIELATAEVTWPDSAKLEVAQCYTGSQGSTATDQCSHAQAIETYATSYTTKQVLEPGEGLTISQSFAKGAFASYLKPNVAPPISQKIIGVIIALGLVLLFAASWPIYQWRRGRKLKRQQTIIPQYEAPDGLSPAEIGTIDVGAPSMKQVSATLIDLAVRGYIRIEQIKPAGLLSKANYRFVKLMPPDGLRDYEQTLYNALFTAGSDSVELASLSRTAMASAVGLVKSTLSKTMQAKGYYQDAKRPWWWITIMGLIAFAFIAVSFVISIIIGAYTIAMLFIDRMTAAGAEEWAKVEGFKWFLRVTEEERLKFSDAPSKTPEQFNKLLPYAVALGVEQEWAKQFEGMDISQSSGWYAGPGGIYTPALLAGSLANDFSGAVSTGFAAPSHSGSGGFSGGGFGGGGGGSW